MDKKESKLCIYSYNSRGIGSNRSEFINDLLSLPIKHIPIFCIQEHFVLRGNLYKLSQVFHNYTVLPKPAIKNFDIQDSGRPMGGLATIIPREFRRFVTVLSCQSWRLQP